MSDQETLESLAAKVGELTNAVASRMKSQGLLPLSFAASSSAEYPMATELAGPRFKLIEVLTDMLHLAKGGKDVILSDGLAGQHNLMVLDVLNQFDFWHAVPVDGSASYRDIAEFTKLPESLVRRILRFAMVNRLFAETAPGSGRVVHTSTTAFIVRNPKYMSWIGHNMEEVKPSTVTFPEALRRYNQGKDAASEKMRESAFGITFRDKVGDDGDFWSLLEKDGEGEQKGYRTRRFAEAMQIARTAASVNFELLIESGFDWASIGEGGTVVDVGGSSGHEAVSLARAFPQLKFIVQDLPSVRDAFNINVPSELATRIMFQEHNFFEPQTVVADVYFMKGILHDWPDEEASKILRTLVRAFRPETRLVLCEGLAPPFDTEEWASMPWVVRQGLSALDLQMLVTFNAKERTVEDWKGLLHRADSRLELSKVFTLPGSSWAVLEIVLRG
ncbi:O-methyltransferase-domain-containing protein [Echria macrotheca]|uniref:O-methyltransferase-domain-containing protein n=1 Tax=Echria macrotheca TaxID=438768 RepID=A0AAJ0FAW3_9PEZI|nr:O-methyltransferase-domain-containing protein [Echria macrotheca]